MFHTIHFTLEQANNMLDEIKSLIEEMVDLKKILDSKNYDIYKHEYFGGMGSNGTGVFPPEMERLVEIVKSISEKGILIKGIDNGLIDFPFIRENGEEVYLCWLLGEDSISYWHKIPDGFSGRKNIEEI